MTTLPANSPRACDGLMLRQVAVGDLWAPLPVPVDATILSVTTEGRTAMVSYLTAGGSAIDRERLIFAPSGETLPADLLARHFVCTCVVEDCVWHLFDRRRA